MNTIQNAVCNGVTNGEQNAVRRCVQNQIQNQIQSLCSYGSLLSGSNQIQVTVTYADRLGIGGNR